MTDRTPKTPKTPKTGKTAKTGKTRKSGKTAKTPMAAVAPPMPRTVTTPATVPPPAASMAFRTPAAPPTPPTPPTPATPSARRTRGRSDAPAAPAAAGYGERVLRNGDGGPDVAELQTRLAGFRGTLPDGDFGPGTERQVRSFQRDVMRLAAPTGVVDRATFEAIDAFADAHPIDFQALRCPCGRCGGFGSGRFRGLYQPGKPEVEAFHRYEYPGVHRLLLWAVRAVFHYMPEQSFLITSGYRCAFDNETHGRTSTNHHGKAIDLDVARAPGENKQDDMVRCDAIRGRIVETADAQIGWLAGNRKALEPSNIAPTWVHYDVRCYAGAYLGDAAFCTTLAGLDARVPIRC